MKSVKAGALKPKRTFHLYGKTFKVVDVARKVTIQELGPESALFEIGLDEVVYVE